MTMVSAPEGAHGGTPGEAGGSAAPEIVYEPEVKALLAAHGVEVPPGVASADVGELARASRQLRAPLVLKAYGPALVHKSDLGAVLLGLGHEDIASAAAEMRERVGLHGKEVAGFLVEEQLRPGLELLLGVVRRPPFGRVVAVGLGGTMTEILDDVAFRLFPLQPADAEALLSGPRLSRLLGGARGAPPLDRHALLRVLLAIAGDGGLAAELGDRLSELECNPVVVWSEGAMALDARLLLSPPSAPGSAEADRADDGSAATDFGPLFEPRGVAVAGASTTKPGFGNRALAAYRSMGWREGLYAVHPSAPEVDGVPAVRSVAEIDRPVDYLLLTVPAAGCPEAVEATGGRVPFVHVVSGGFREAGPEGRRREDELLDAGRRVGTRLLGPNCIGMYCPKGRQTFQLDVPETLGSVAVVSQSGGLAGDIIKAGSVRGIGFSKVATVGNAIDVSPGELLQWLVRDPDTEVIGIYLEGSADAERIVEGLRQAHGRVPVAILLGGQTPSGAAAVASHTGSLAGDRRIWDAATEATGSALVTRFEDLLAALAYGQRWSAVPVTPGGGTVVLGVGGGASVLAADACARSGVELTPTTAEAAAGLRAMGYGVGTSVANPVEIPFGPVTPVDTLRDVIDELLDVQTYADVLVHVNVQAYYSYGTEGVRPLVAQMASYSSRPWTRTRTGVVVRNLECAPPEDAETVRSALVDLGLPSFRDFDEAAAAIAAMERFSAARPDPA